MMDAFLLQSPPKNTGERPAVPPSHPPHTRGKNLLSPPGSPPPPPKSNSPSLPVPLPLNKNHLPLPYPHLALKSSRKENSQICTCSFTVRRHSALSTSICSGSKLASAV